MNDSYPIFDPWTVRHISWSYTKQTGILLFWVGGGGENLMEATKTDNSFSTAH